MVREVFSPSREINKVVKRGRPSDVKVGILMPIPYKAAVNSLAMQLFYEYINSLDGAIAYRFTYDMNEDVLESKDYDISLRYMDLIMVSASFELDYINVARILYTLNLTPRQKGRKKPIVIAGGLAPTSNPLPLSGIVDAVVIGEAEEVLEELVYSVKDENPYRILEGMRCVAVSPFEYKVKRCYVENLDRAWHPVKQVYSVDEEPVFGYGMRIELSRGCAYLCPFCMEAHITYPFRYRSFSTAWRLVEEGLNAIQIARRVVIYSLSFFSIPYADTLLDKLLIEGIQASVPSLRVDHLNRRRLEVMAMLGQKTLTIAPETVVEGYGCRIGKCSRAEDIAEIILEAYRIGYGHVKLYLITGFPNIDESEELRALESFLNMLKDVEKRGFLEISLNLLIPKPWTPFQFLPPKHVLDVASRVKGYQRIARRWGASVDAMNAKWGFIQAVIAQGDRDISDVIVKCALDRCGPSRFIKMISGMYGRYRYIDEGWQEGGPWMDVVDMGFNPRYLRYRFDYLTKFHY